jgi:hypothetical protein
VDAHVLVAVRPRMFGDALGRLIAGFGVEVAHVDPALPLPPSVGCSVALISEGVSEPAGPGLVVTVLDDPAGEVLAEARFAAGLVIAVRRLPRLLALVRVGLADEVTGPARV